MKCMSHLSESFCRSARVVIFLGFITAAGCDSGENVLTPPEGGATTDQAKPKAPKPNPKMSTRQEREKAAAQ
jgi:hypothetical protein